MPFFIGAVWDKEYSLKANTLPIKFSKILSKHTDNKVIDVKTDYWLVSTSLKMYETQQEEIHVLPHHRGVGIGRFYGKSDNDTHFHILNENIDSTQISQRILSERYWGRHILILANDQKRRLSIFRDVIGLSQIYFIALQNVMLFSSDIYLLTQVIEEEGHCLEIDWEYFASLLSCGLLHTSKTPLKTIKALLPGCVLTYENKTLEVKPFWDPTSLPLEQPINEKKLASVFNNCVKSLSRNTTSIGLQLSGGLDSSSLFLSLKNSLKAHQEFLLINYRNKRVASSDESEYVNMLIQGSNLQLIDHDLEYNLEIHNTRKWNLPYPNILELKSKIGLFKNIKSSSFELFSGHGGDYIFLSKANPAFLTDYLLEKGFKGFLAKLKSLSIINRSPLLPYLYDTVKYLYGHYFKKSYEKFAVFPIRHEVWFNNKIQELIKAQSFLPAFVDNLYKIHPGKALHILQAYHSSASIGLEPEKTEVYPYLAQPLIELGLSFPTYSSFNESWSRLHFRNAISNYFNTNFVWRQPKGEISGVIQLFVKNNLKKIEELCLEGKFSQQDFIDKNLLRKELLLLANGRVEGQWPILRLISAELWLNANV